MRDTSLQRRFGRKGSVFFRIYQNKPEKKKKKYYPLKNKEFDQKQKLDKIKPKIERKIVFLFFFYH